MNEKIQLLYVDDEEHNLMSFKASFRRKYDIDTAISGEEGLKLVQNKKFDIIITDQRMPGLTGIEFLQKVLEIDPEPMRILLTGYSDISAVIDAINFGQVYRYLSKPWSEDEITQAVAGCYEVLQLRRENKRLLKELEQANEQLEFMLRQKLLS